MSGRRPAPPERLLRSETERGPAELARTLRLGCGERVVLLVRASFPMAATVLGQRAAKLLETPPGTAGWWVERLMLTVGDRPVTRMAWLYRSEQHRLAAGLGPIPGAEPNGSEGPV